MSIATLRTTRMPLIETARAIVPPFLWQMLYKRFVVKSIVDAELYTPNYSPWSSLWFQRLYRDISSHTLVSPQRCWTLWQGMSQALHVPGDIMEAGVFQGGTARLLKLAASDKPDKQLYLFDSFEGMVTVTDDKDRHRRGDFSDTSVEYVRKFVAGEGNVHIRKGWIPDSFDGLENNIFCFAHIDLDLYQSVRNCLEFLYPRLSRSAIIVVDDYGFASCPGARKAVDDFFADKPEFPLALSTSQAVVHKL